MKIISWNLNSRSNKFTLENQCNFLKSDDFDFITLQDVTIKSQILIKEYFKDYFSKLLRYQLKHKKWLLCAKPA